MPELKSYPKLDVPREVAAQIRSYVRVQWPFLDARDGRIWDVPPASSDARTFVVLDGETLVSHAEANFRDVARRRDLPRRRPQRRLHLSRLPRRGLRMAGRPCGHRVPRRERR